MKKRLKMWLSENINAIRLKAAANGCLSAYQWTEISVAASYGVSAKRKLA
jgi:hypothetical protein